MQRLRGLLIALSCALVVATPAVAAPLHPAITDPGYNWAVAPLNDLVAHHGWPATDTGTLGRISTRREVARGLSELMRAHGAAPPAALRRPSDVAATDPDVTTMSWVSTIGLYGSPGAAFTPTAAVTARETDLAIAHVLGLNAELNALGSLHMQNGTRLAIPAGFAQEALIAALGLHHDYPTAQENLGVPASAPLPLAELAGMIDGAIKLGASAPYYVGSFTGIVLPNMTVHQRTATEAALAQVGMPYVWGGSSPNTQTLFGSPTVGGFDCSGLVWWSYKFSPASAALRLGSDVVGRTADAMAWEQPSQKVAVADLQAGDLVFFGPKGTKSARGTISHVGISLGNGWMIQSSDGGVSIVHLAGWWDSALAWGRRPAAMGTVATVVVHHTPPTMTPALWAKVKRFLRTHYRPTARARLWMYMRMHPTTAYALLHRHALA